MKNLLGLLVIAGVVMFFAIREKENGASYLDKYTGSDGLLDNIQKADITADIYKDITQNRINAEFEN